MVIAFFFFHFSFFALGPCLAGPKLKILGLIHSIVRTRKRIFNHFDGAQLEQLYIYMAETKPDSRTTLKSSR